MSIFWSSAATGVALSIATLAAVRVVSPEWNRPDALRGDTGTTLLGALSIVSPILLLYFCYRAFTDEGAWALLQIPFAAFVGAWMSRSHIVANGITPFLLTAFSFFVANRIWERS